MCRFGKKNDRSAEFAFAFEFEFASAFGGKLWEERNLGLEKLFEVELSWFNFVPMDTELQITLFFNSEVGFKEEADFNSIAQTKKSNSLYSIQKILPNSLQLLLHLFSFNF